MHQTMFVNLPIAHVDVSREFFTSLGYTFDEDFCDDNALCLELNDSTFAMLLQRDFFASFADRPVGDAKADTQHLLALGVSTREGVDDLVDKAVAAGGKDVRTDDNDFMYSRSYADLDGHVWELMWMNTDNMGDKEA